MRKELPSLKPKELVGVLERAGFILKRKTGSHAILYKPGILRPISIPVHTKELPKGTLRAIIRQANLPIDDFLKLL
ncbi:MAG: type II toxin-antitoxin system HicA family toxin [Dehalococcoidales bacterium]|nr:type II toxin-antitoxin system HicA family toxin [Dehalococcoidales bacterium]